MEITEKELNKLDTSLNGITDIRRQSGHFLHKLKDVLIIGLKTVIAGWDE